MLCGSADSGFYGREEALKIVMDVKPDILNHNIETVERMSDRVRAKAKYTRSLQLLKNAKAMRRRFRPNPA